MTYFSFFLYRFVITSGLKIQIQNNKQIVSGLKRKSSETLEELIAPEISSNRIVSRWTNDEVALAIRGVREFGKNFQSIADLIGTKTEAHVRTFYTNNRRKYDLDDLIKQFDEKNQQKEELLKNNDKENENQEKSNAIVTATTSNTNAKVDTVNDAKKDNHILEVSINMATQMLCV